MAHVRPQRLAFFERTGGSIELQQFLRAQRAHPDAAAIGGSHHAIGLHGSTQFEGGDDRERVGRDDADRAAVAVAHPGVPGVVDGDGAGAISHRNLFQQRLRAAVEHGHGVLVRVDHPDARGGLPVVGDQRGRLRALLGHRQCNGGSRRALNGTTDAQHGRGWALRQVVGIVAGQGAVGRRAGRMGRGHHGGRILAGLGVAVAGATIRDCRAIAGTAVAGTRIGDVARLWRVAGMGGAVRIGGIARIGGVTRLGGRVALAAVATVLARCRAG